MAVFHIPVTWQERGEFLVEADTIEEAIEKVYANEKDEFSTTASDPEYVDDSFSVIKPECRPAEDYEIRTFEAKKAFQKSRDEFNGG